MGIEIDIVEGNLEERFREKEELGFLADRFGKEPAKRYYSGFTRHATFTLAIRKSKRLIGSALLKVYGGTVNISELVTIEDGGSLMEALRSVEDWAVGRGFHKIWLIDNPRLGRTGIYERLGFVVEGKLEGNICGQDELLFALFPRERPGGKRERFDISILTGNRYSGFREEKQLLLLADLLGEKGMGYREGFRQKKEMTLIIRDGKRLIGSAAITISGGLFGIGAFVIKEAYRGEGIGTRALTMMEETARRSGCHKMWLITNPDLRVVNLYNRQGWKVEATLKRNIAGFDEVLMSKRL